MICKFSYTGDYSLRRQITRHAYSILTNCLFALFSGKRFSKSAVLQAFCLTIAIAAYVKVNMRQIGCGLLQALTVAYRDILARTYGKRGLGAPKSNSSCQDLLTNYLHCVCVKTV